MDLLKQQSKLEWLKYRDDCTKLFFARVKQRKLATYIYTIKDEDIGKVMLSFYKNLLGKQFTPRSSIDLEKGTFPLKHPGVPITANRLSKTECRPLIEKIMARVHLWATGEYLEDDEHILFQCSYAKEVWSNIRQWWPVAKGNIDAIPRTGGPAAKRNITYAITSATIYLIWHARNHCIFKGYSTPAASIAP
ncbi:hypothetical protein Cgig2_020957 [Carnegiea gigantea]|uniref:Uncharacterized protein n=1 Tax=Carnegiea gigantea TaxID=171969 RepID=A0A9Q1GJ32_9CARY|nr:hypothetical protein Cgig2_020957 [Carnegiea gigantea]